MRICAYRRVRVTAAVGLTEAGRVSGPAEGRRLDGSTRYMYRELQYARAESRGSEKVRMEARRPSGGHATRQQGISGEMGVPSLLQARLPFPRQRSCCIGATRQGFPNGSLCSALTGPVADAGQISWYEGMAGYSPVKHRHSATDNGLRKNTRPQDFA